MFSLVRAMHPRAMPKPMHPHAMPMPMQAPVSAPCAMRASSCGISQMGRRGLCPLESGSTSANLSERLM